MPINDTSDFKIQEWVEINESSKANEMRSHIDNVIKSLEKASQSIATATGYKATWEGAAEKIHSDLYNFCHWYSNDLPPALHAYRDAVNVLAEELEELYTSSNIIQKFNNIEEL